MTDRPTSSEPRIPKYYGLKRHLLELTRAMPPGSALPPERVLSTQFGISRTTVRQALHELVVEGRLERVQGRGTFVARPKVAQPLRLAGWLPWHGEGPCAAAARSDGATEAHPEPAHREGDSPDAPAGRAGRSDESLPGSGPAAGSVTGPTAGSAALVAAGSAAGTGAEGGAESRSGSRSTGWLLRAEQLEADPELAAQLAVRRGSRVLRVERLRTAENEPMAVEVTWLAARRFPSLLRRLQRTMPAVATAAVDAALTTAYGASGPPAGEETIETVLATPREAALLGTDVGAPLLLLCRLGRDRAGVPVEWAQAWYRGDRYKFVLTSPYPGSRRS